MSRDPLAPARGLVIGCGAAIAIWLLIAVIAIAIVAALR